jgi:hypothetical protein
MARTVLLGTDFAAITLLVDHFGIMNYDRAGPWRLGSGLPNSFRLLQPI